MEMVQEEQQQQEVKRKEPIPTAASLAVANVLLSWILLFLFPISLLLSITLYYVTSRYSKKASVISFLASPYCVIPVIGVVCATIGYWSGNAVFYEPYQPPKARFGTYCPEYGTRFEWYGGDIGWLFFSLHQIPNNATLYAHCDLFGPVRYNYTGPTPTFNDAKDLIESTNNCIDAQQFRSGSFVLNGRVIHLSTIAKQYCLGMVQFRDPAPPTIYTIDPQQPFRVAIFDTDCLVVLTKATNGGCFITLIDAATGRYIDQESDSSH